MTFGIVGILAKFIFCVFSLGCICVMALIAHV